METRYLVKTLYSDAHTETDRFEAKDEALLHSQHLLHSRGDEISVLDVIRQEWHGNLCLRATVIKHVQ